ncbi:MULTISPECIES: hypothetical protein [unclassified Saccharibacter]|uniref:hypothetical protein n=1 Tax=unclassified Saccharibacter TaxID=2648722 RepID=UPI0013214424|nr:MULTISPECIES: hypothetical protein [unclassified Saccharibacter]MXV36337.1 hypothetical protein [Saccharibacter sp. EH611]MXV57196.1 hypothetical protein [Saccharibacter sp. EH70]MXV66444.1 hypothetical protein [Saccharibacter sp. EH60]
MNPYFAGSFILTVLSFLTALIIYSTRAGRNSARVHSERQDASDATQSAKAAQRMLEARTNGIRSGDELTEELDKGTF